MMERLDKNSDGKLEESEMADLPDQFRTANPYTGISGQFQRVGQVL